MSESRDITWHATRVSPEARAAVTGNHAAIVWLTGLSASGKSTLAMALEQALMARGNVAYVLDGDNIRHGLNADLGFSADNRTENIRRIGEVAKLFVDAGLIVITSFISPYRADRARVRGLMGPGQFIEVFVDTPLAVCQERDPKGLYQKARAAAAAGTGLQFTGIDAPYETPETPEIHLHPERQSVDEAVRQMLDYLAAHGRFRQ